MIKRPITYSLIPYMVLPLLFYGCIEEFSAKFVDFESALVINATITDQLKQQEIQLSRTYKFSDEGPEGEQNAQVWVTSADGTRFDFQEGEAGTYRSEMAFAAVPNTDYTLSVTTQNGRSYTSNTARLSGSTQLDTLYAERITSDLGEDGMAIVISNSGDPESSGYYRYEYEETYKIIAPRFVGRDLAINPDGGWLFPERPLDEKVCYTTDLSSQIVLADTEDLDENRLERLMVRFISRDNYIISHRYSVLVRQYVQSFEAYNFYETLNNFSAQESLFSETQPGFLEGNVFSRDNKEEKVLGFFDVSTVHEKRIFFNYEDFFPGEPLPPYADPCGTSTPPEDKLFNQVDLNLIKYIDTNPEPGPFAGPYIITPRICGDCTVLGIPEVPEFWTE
ncbi:protein of unknown function [Flagellimonas flava]|uniref:DUF4249 domain-containing protein n=2 Tax=Flagellimonas flava TaxID=570519 RepID=A0A1M5IFF9_9FLAO|nr:protein of unknown function [Allomuricauda flava]